MIMIVLLKLSLLTLVLSCESENTYQGSERKVVGSAPEDDRSIQRSQSLERAREDEVPDDSQENPLPAPPPAVEEAAMEPQIDQLPSPGVAKSVPIPPVAQPVRDQGQDPEDSISPTISKMPSTPASFCQGVGDLTGKITQEIDQDIKFLCNGASPTKMFLELVENPYQGGDQVDLRVLVNRHDDDRKRSFFWVAFSVKMDGLPKDMLAIEEKQAAIPYKKDKVEISGTFVDPPDSPGKALAAFHVDQFMKVSDRVSFVDTSMHTLKMYRPFVQNQDIFASVRTLNEKTEQFDKLTIIRAVVANPEDAKSTVNTSLVLVEMNSRDEHRRTVDAYREFTEASVRQLHELPLKKEDVP